jgi:hypothetical protein
VLLDDYTDIGKCGGCILRDLFRSGAVVNDALRSKRPVFVEAFNCSAVQVDSEKRPPPPISNFFPPLPASFEMSACILLSNASDTKNSIRTSEIRSSFFQNTPA